MIATIVVALLMVPRIGHSATVPFQSRDWIIVVPFENRTTLRWRRSRLVERVRSGQRSGSNSSCGFGRLLSGDIGKPLVLRFTVSASEEPNDSGAALSPWYIHCRRDGLKSRIPAEACQAPVYTNKHQPWTSVPIGPLQQIESLHRAA